MKTFKFTLTVLALLSFTTLTFSQTGKGNISIGGSSNLGFSFTNFKSEFNGNTQGELKTTSFNLAPRAGYFIIDNLLAGISIPLNFSKEKYPDGDTNTINSILVVPFVRYYFTSKNIKPYIQGEIGFGSRNSKFSNTGLEFESRQFFYSASGGVAYFINDIVSFDLGLCYKYINSKPIEGSISSTIFTTTNLGANVGINIFL